jgi:hypothetical protein
MIINLEELELGGKKVLIRQDLNVPIKAGVVTSDKRIKASLPTIEMAMKQGAKVLSNALPNASSSPDNNGPEQAIGAYLATPCVEACARR